MTDIAVYAAGRVVIRWLIGCDGSVAAGRAVRGTPGKPSDCCKRQNGHAPPFYKGAAAGRIIG